MIPNFFAPNKPKRSREEVRRDLGVTDKFLVLHMSNLRPVKRIDLLLRTIAMSREPVPPSFVNSSRRPF